MTEWTFRLTLAGVELTDEQLDALFEAGCDDVTFSLEQGGTVLGLFDRVAESQEDAVLSAFADVHAAGVGARVLRVEADDDWLTASEIAERVGRSREGIRLLIRGQRGPGDFPRAVARAAAVSPLWSWAEVEEWFDRYEPGAVVKRGARMSPDFVAEVNDLLDLRERRRRAPHAPWRLKLAAALPLGA